MRRLLLILLLLLPTLVFAQDMRRTGDWTPLAGGGCIGGSKCRETRIRVPLADRPVIAVRFTAHDSIGDTAGGQLRVKIGADTVRSSIDIPRKGETFTIDVQNLRGTTLTIEAQANDEVEVTNIAVMYGRDEPRPRPGDGGGRPGSGGDRPGGGRPGSGGNDGWKSYPRAAGCIGGDECRKNGTRIIIALDSAPILGIRFFAHDQIGTRADGRLNVYLDDKAVASYIDIQRNGKRHDFDVDNVRATRLVISTATDDEVEVRDIEVLYGRGGYGGGYGGGSGGSGGGSVRETRHAGGCIGGNECGGRRRRIRVELRDRPVDSIRFYAHDQVGQTAGGELRIVIDGQTLRDYLDIPREGRNFTIDGKGIAGEYLDFEPAKDDEVVIKDIVVQYRDR